MSDTTQEGAVLAEPLRTAGLPRSFIRLIAERGLILLTVVALGTFTGSPSSAAAAPTAFVSVGPVGRQFGFLASDGSYSRPELGYLVRVPAEWQLIEEQPGAPTEPGELKGAEISAPGDEAVITLLAQLAVGEDARYWMDRLETAPPPDFRRFLRLPFTFHGLVAEWIESAHTSPARGPQRATALTFVRGDLAYLILFQVDDNAWSSLRPVFGQFLNDWQWVDREPVKPGA